MSPINYPTSLDAFTNPEATDTLDSPSHSEQHSDANDALEALEAKVGIDDSAVITSHEYWLRKGWIAAGKTWTYASADDPTFTFTIAAFDATSVLSAGMKIKLTQTTVKYFIITKVVFDDPGSTITVYGGTDYDLVDATITSPFYSSARTPQGFPLDPDKWSVEVTDGTSRTSAGISANTWTNVGTTLINIPIGLWIVNYAVSVMAISTGSESTITAIVTLSTGNNNESHALWGTGLLGAVEAAYTGVRATGWLCKSNVMDLATKDTFYLNMQSNRDANLQYNNAYGDLVIKAVCAYL